LAKLDDSTKFGVGPPDRLFGGSLIGNEQLLTSWGSAKKNIYTTQ